MPTGFPSRGLELGGNNVRPIRWWPWRLAALTGGLAFGCPLGTTVGGVAGALAGTLFGACIALVTLMHPLRQRNYRFPEPAALRIAPDGLQVHLAEHGRWRPGSYLHLPWPAIAQLTLIDGPLPPATNPSLRIRLTLAGRTMITGLSTAARHTVDADGCLIVPQIATTELLRALTHYSGGRFTSLQPEPAHPLRARLPIDVDFTVVLRGYEMAAVDGLVRRTQGTLASGSPAARAAAREELQQVAFRVCFRGYDRTQVDEYLRRAAALLA
jgi:DivIVA domain-containing protein